MAPLMMSPLSRLSRRRRHQRRALQVPASVERGLHASREVAGEFSARARHEAEVLAHAAQPALKHAPAMLRHQQDQPKRSGRGKRLLITVAILTAVSAVVFMLLRRGRGESHDYGMRHDHMPPGGAPSWTPPVPVPAESAAPDRSPAWPVERDRPRESADDPAVAPTAAQDWPGVMAEAAMEEAPPDEQAAPSDQPAASAESPRDEVATGEPSWQRYTLASDRIASPSEDERPVSPPTTSPTTTSGASSSSGASTNGAGSAPFTWSNRAEKLRPAPTPRQPFGRPQLPPTRSVVPPSFVRPSLPGDTSSSLPGA